MKTDDQWFEPGDKVMEVDAAHEVAAIDPRYHLWEESSTKKGVVYCVEKFEEQWPLNAVWLTGVDCEPDGLIAMEFRKVEEIRLCVNAVNQIKQPQIEKA